MTLKQKSKTSETRAVIKEMLERDYFDSAERIFCYVEGVQDLILDMKKEIVKREIGSEQKNLNEKLIIILGYSRNLKRTRADILKVLGANRFLLDGKKSILEEYLDLNDKEFLSILNETKKEGIDTTKYEEKFKKFSSRLY